MPDWALATTPANAEHLVSADLDRFGYVHWIFHRRVTRAYRGRIIRSQRPAFPRYILVPFEQCWAILRDVWRIVGIVCFGERVARVRERDVNRLIERCGGGNVLPPETIPELFARGERVHIGGVGLFAGHDAFYQNAVGDGKLRVMFNMMGRMVPIDVDQRDVSEITRKRCRKRVRRRRGRNHRNSGLTLRATGPA